MEPLFRDLEMPLIPVLARMERSGVRIDVPFFREMSRKHKRELELIQQEIWKEAGSEFNLNSTPQLREVLFERLNFRCSNGPRLVPRPMRACSRSWPSRVTGSPVC